MNLSLYNIFFQYKNYQMIKNDFLKLPATAKLEFDRINSL